MPICALFSAPTTQAVMIDLPREKPLISLPMRSCAFLCGYVKNWIRTPEMETMQQTTTAPLRLRARYSAYVWLNTHCMERSPKLIGDVTQRQASEHAAERAGTVERALPLCL